MEPQTDWASWLQAPAAEEFQFKGSDFQRRKSNQRNSKLVSKSFAVSQHHDVDSKSTELNCNFLACPGSDDDAATPISEADTTTKCLELMTCCRAEGSNNVLGDFFLPAPLQTSDCTNQKLPGETVQEGLLDTMVDWLFPKRIAVSKKVVSAQGQRRNSSDTSNAKVVAEKDSNSRWSLSQSGHVLRRSLKGLARSEGVSLKKDVLPSVAHEAPAASAIPFQALLPPASQSVVTQTRLPTLDQGSLVMRQDSIPDLRSTLSRPVARVKVESVETAHEAAILRKAHALPNIRHQQHTEVTAESADHMQMSGIDAVTAQQAARFVEDGPVSVPPNNPLLGKPAILERTGPDMLQHVRHRIELRASARAKLLQHRKSSIHESHARHTKTLHTNRLSHKSTTTRVARLHSHLHHPEPHGPGQTLVNLPDGPILAVSQVSNPTPQPLQYSSTNTFDVSQAPSLHTQTLIASMQPSPGHLWQAQQVAVVQRPADLLLTGFDSNSGSFVLSAGFQQGVFVGAISTLAVEAFQLGMLAQESPALAVERTKTHLPVAAVRGAFFGAAGGCIAMTLGPTAPTLVFVGCSVLSEWFQQALCWSHNHVAGTAALKRVLEVSGSAAGGVSAAWATAGLLSGGNCVLVAAAASCVGLLGSLGGRELALQVLPSRSSRRRLSKSITDDSSAVHQLESGSRKSILKPARRFSTSSTAGHQNQSRTTKRVSFSVDA